MLTITDESSTPPPSSSSLSSSKDDIEWFVKRLSNLVDGISNHEIIFERNEFVESHLRQLREISSSGAGKTFPLDSVSLKEATLKLKEASARYRKIFEKLGTNADVILKGRDEFLQLKVLLGESCCEKSQRQISQKFQDIDKSLLLGKEYVEEAKKLLLHCQRLSSLVESAKNEYYLWGKKDCNVGLTELNSSLHTISLKYDEYKNRLHRLESECKELFDSQPLPQPIKIQNALRQILELEGELKRLEDNLRPFQSLPADLTLATVKLEEAKRQLNSLIFERDQILRKLNP